MAELNVRINNAKAFNKIEDLKTRVKLGNMFGEGDPVSGCAFVLDQISGALGDIYNNAGTVAKVGHHVLVGGFLNPIGNGCYFAEITKVGYDAGAKPFYFVKLNF